MKDQNKCGNYVKYYYKKLFTSTELTHILIQITEGESSIINMLSKCA